jgi:hypothetical protein
MSFDNKQIFPCLGLLSINHQSYHECVAIVYSRKMFVSSTCGTDRKHDIKAGLLPRVLKHVRMPFDGSVLRKIWRLKQEKL